MGVEKSGQNPDWPGTMTSLARHQSQPKIMVCTSIDRLDAMAAPAPGANRHTGKSATAFRTISEVAGELAVPQHVLRFWETKFAQIRPLKRGGGRRYYRPDDIALLRRIKALLYTDGYTIKGVQKLMRGAGAATLDAGGKASAASASAGSRPAGSAKSVRDRVVPDVRAEVEAVLGELRAVRDLLKRTP